MYTHTHTRIGYTVVRSTRSTSGRVMRTSVSSRKRRPTLVPSTPWQPPRSISSQVHDDVMYMILQHFNSLIWTEL